MIDPALAELAESCGIEPGFHDIWGVWREAGEETVRSLLAAMGIALDRPGAAQKALRKRVKARWSSMVDETLVTRRSALADGVPVRLPASAVKILGWRIVEEEGALHEGESSIAALRIADEIEIDGTRRRAVRLPLPDLPTGYHKLEIVRAGRTLASAMLIVTPERCFQPNLAHEDARYWGVVLQLYGLRSERNWGIGDFGDLAEAADQWAARGAAFVGVNPLHALYLATPEHASPYSPSSRLFLNPLYLDIEAIEEFHVCEEARALVAAADFAGRAGELRLHDMVDYHGVAAAKTRVLKLLHAQFRRTGEGHRAGRGRGYENFRRERGEALRLFATYEALHEHFKRGDPGIGSWQQWPVGFHDPRSPEVEKFAVGHAERIDYFMYLQWQCASQLAAAHAAARHGGIGLYLDLAVSVDRGGADAWAWQDLYALGASIGAPPDDFNPQGQDWGLPPFNPEAIRKAGYSAFIGTLRANMASAGALRIDHVLGLARLFWKAGAAEGAYVRYPIADLLGIIALESQRHGCMVIGEDLGTVPVQLRHALREWGVLSYRLLMFERDSAGQYNPLGDVPALSMVAFSTHDLPTFAGFWRAQDRQARGALLEALRKSKVAPDGVDPDAELDPEALGRLCHAVHVYLARSAARMFAVQLDDLAGATAQANVPGTPDCAPNWRRKLPLSLEAMSRDPRLPAIFGELAAARGNAPSPDADSGR